MSRADSAPLDCASGSADPVAQALASWRATPTPWVRIAASGTPTGGVQWVYRASSAPDDIVVVASRPEPGQSAHALSVPSVGLLSRWRLVDDARLPTLPALLRRHPNAEVLRYRPGKRVTLRVDDRIAKVFADDRGQDLSEIHRQLGSIRDLPCSVPLGLDYDATLRVFWQCRLAGEPLEPRLHDADPQPWLLRIATALAHLHRSDARFALTSDSGYQQRRTEHYFRKLDAPADIQTQFAGLRCALQDVERRVLARATQATARPLHGSPHLHQWLAHGTRLGLVDFDRAGMGDVELDLATLVAEIDFEPTLAKQSLATQIIAAYRDAGGDIDAERLAFYRAHKHLAKALKQLRAASTTPARSTEAAPYGRVLRTLRGASDLLVPFDRSPGTP